MATISELFGNAAPTVPAPQPEPKVDSTGAPPGDQRYGKGIPLTDQMAGKTLTQLLEDAGERMDAQAYIAKYLKPMKPPVYSGAWGKQELFFRNTGKGANPTADTLLVIASKEAQAYLKGETPEQPLVGAAAPEPGAMA
jgi:uracil-DNA glycosylase